MKHLTLTLEEEIRLINRYRLTPNELLIVRVLLLLQDNQEESLLHELMDSLRLVNINLRDVLIELQNKEVILKSYKIPETGTVFNPFEIPINKNFIKGLYKASFELGKELFDVYPQFATINGSVIPLRTVAKKFDSLEEAYFKYGKSINFNIDKHNEIVSLVRWANENNILNCSLASFIVNQGWIDLYALKNDGGAANINYDAIRIL